MYYNTYEITIELLRHYFRRRVWQDLAKLTQVIRIHILARRMAWRMIQKLSSDMD